MTSSENLKVTARTYASDQAGGSASTAPAGILEKGLALLPPLPNPTRGETMLRFQLPESSEVDLSVFDLRGRRVVTIFDGPTYSPNTSVRWDGRDASGQWVQSQGSSTRRAEVVACSYLPDRPFEGRVLRTSGFLRSWSS